MVVSSSSIISTSGGVTRTAIPPRNAELANYSREPLLARPSCGGNQPLPFWLRLRSLLLFRCRLKCGDVEFHHVHNRFHRFRVLQDLANLLRHNLPAEAELVRQPAAGHGLAIIEQLVPIGVNLGLGPCTPRSTRKPALAPARGHR